MHYQINTDQIKCYPESLNNDFQPWNSADEHIIKYLNENNITFNSVLIIEDKYGALTSAFPTKRKFIVQDSYNSKKATLFLENNNSTFLSPFDEFPKVDLVIGKIPKNLRYYRFLMNKINCSQNNNSKVIFSGMIKYLAKSFYDESSKYFKNCKTSLGWKKSRLVLATTENQQLENFITIIKHDDFDVEVVNYPNMFSSQKLDIGTRYFLENFTKINFIPKSILDLGCGNGILGISLAKTFAEAELYFTDIQGSAIKSTEDSIKKNNINNYYYLFQTNVLENFPNKKIDLIVCNPPFHDQHSLTINTSLSMFREAKNILSDNGELWIVANRHLGYLTHLRNIFAKVDSIIANRKFKIFRCRLLKNT